jgi:hypothetical protein
MFRHIEFQNASIREGRKETQNRPRTRGIAKQRKRRNEIQESKEAGAETLEILPAPDRVTPPLTPVRSSRTRQDGGDQPRWRVTANRVPSKWCLRPDEPSGGGCERDDGTANPDAVVGTQAQTPPAPPLCSPSHRVRDVPPPLRSRRPGDLPRRAGRTGPFRWSWASVSWTPQ